MRVGSCRLDIILPPNRSLKDKRRVLKSLSQRCRNKFNVAVAEVDYHDVLNRIGLGIVTVAADEDHCNRSLMAVLRWLEANVEVIDFSYELESF